MKSDSFMYGYFPYMAQDMQDAIPYGSDSFYGAKLAYCYVPYQRHGKLYSECEALKNGTVFPALDKPLSKYGLEFCSECNCEEDN